MISKKDSRPILVKFPVGISKTNKTSKIYEEEWQIIYGLIGNNYGLVQRYLYGMEQQFDILITVNAGSISRRIDDDTIFMIDEVPTSNYPLGNYKVSKIYPEYNNEILIGLSAVSAVDVPKLYFYNNGIKLYTQLNFDKNTNKAYIKKRLGLPFKVGEYVYTKEPSSEEQTENRLAFSSYKETGLDDKYRNFYELIFTSGD